MRQPPPSRIRSGTSRGAFASIQGYSFGEVIEAPEQYSFGDFRLPVRRLAIAGVAAFSTALEPGERLYPFGAATA